LGVRFGTNLTGSQDWGGYANTGSDAGKRALIVQFDFRPNAGPSRPYINPLFMAPFVPVAIFAGLTPGQVGLYQINVKIPDTLPSVAPCTTAVAGNALNPLNVVQSNLTINVSTVASFDGAAICLQPPQ
jgi:hypothetical protein